MEKGNCYNINDQGFRHNSFLLKSKININYVNNLEFQFTMNQRSMPRTFTTLTYSPETILCDLGLCCRVLHIHELTSPSMTSYTVYYTTGAWLQQEKLTHRVPININLGVPEFPCCLR